MMRSIYIFALTASLLFAAGVKEAKDLYSQKNYEQSYSAFKSLFKSNMSDFEINLFLARSAKETKRQNEAIASYERALMIDSSSAVARFELAALYYDMHLYDQSESEFKKVLSRPLPQDVRRNVLQYMAAISQGRKKHNFSLQASIGVIDDSNVYFDSEKDLFGLTNSAVSDTAHYEQIVLNHIYSMRSRDSFWQTKAAVLNQEYFHEEDSRIVYPSIESGWLYRSKDFSLFLPIGVSVLSFGNAEIYKDISVGATLDKPLNSYESLQVSLKLIHRDYEVREVDSNLADLKVDLRHRNDTGEMFIYSAGFNYEKPDKSGFSKVTTANLGAKWYKGLKSGWSFDAGANAKHRSESETIAAFDKKRQDNSIDISGSLNIPIDKSSYLTLNASYTHSESNIDIFDYKKQVVGVSYNVYFGSDDIKRSSR